MFSILSNNKIIHLKRFSICFPKCWFIFLDWFVWKVVYIELFNIIYFISHCCMRYLPVTRICPRNLENKEGSMPTTLNPRLSGSRTYLTVAPPQISIGEIIHRYDCHYHPISKSLEWFDFSSDSGVPHKSASHYTAEVFLWYTS